VILFPIRRLSNPSDKNPRYLLYRIQGRTAPSTRGELLWRSPTTRMLSRRQRRDQSSSKTPQNVTFAAITSNSQTQCRLQASVRRPEKDLCDLIALPHPKRARNPAHSPFVSSYLSPPDSFSTSRPGRSRPPLLPPPRLPPLLP
jgi:hypothetical protein